MKNYYNMSRFLLSPDVIESTGTVATTTELDPLATNVSDIDLSRPIAPPSNYEMQVSEAKVDDNKAKTGQNLIIKWKNTREIKSVKGDMLMPGQLVLMSYTGIVPTEKRTNKMIAQDLARFAKGLGLPGSLSPRDIINNPSVLSGKIGLVKIAVAQETSEFPERNEVKGVVIEG